MFTDCYDCYYFYNHQSRWICELERNTHTHTHGMNKLDAETIVICHSGSSGAVKIETLLKHTREQKTPKRNAFFVVVVVVVCFEFCLDENNKRPYMMCACMIVSPIWAWSVSHKQTQHTRTQCRWANEWGETIRSITIRLIYTTRHSIEAQNKRLQWNINFDGLRPSYKKLPFVCVHWTIKFNSSDHHHSTIYTQMHAKN